MRTLRPATLLLVALPLLAGCPSDESLNPPAVANPLFLRYAALGNSITAGFQSLGIDDSTQQRSYARLLSLAMQTTFNYPKLTPPGCPPPFTNNVTQARVGGPTSSATTCGAPPLPPRIPVPGLLNNLAVPGNQVGTLLHSFGGPPSAFDPLKTILLGGKTELQLTQALQPTLATLWIGNNDVLGALISLTNAGDSSQITPVTKFNAQFDSVRDVLTATGAKVAVISVANVTSIPFASPAAIYYCLKNGGCPSPLPPQDPRLAGIPTFTVNVNCAPPGGLGYGVPWPIALGKVQAAAAGSPQTLSCTDTVAVISPQEYAAMATAVTAFNAHIAAVAAARGWAYWDINPALTALRTAGTIPTFPDVNGAFANPPTSVLFGPIFSLDGIHPSSIAHRLIADSVAAAINRTYGTSLPVPVCGAVTCPAAP